MIKKLFGWFGVKRHLDLMNEKRPLPVGMNEFEEWSDRIISGTMLPADPESQKFALATMLMHLAPTVDHEIDGYFIKSLRKSAVNQIAHAKMTEIRDRAKARLAEEEAKKNADQSQAVLSDAGGAALPGPDDGEAESEPHTEGAIN